MNDLIQMGPFVLRWGMVALVAGAVAALLLIYIQLRKETYKRQLLDLLVNSVLILVFSWKLGAFILHPISSWNNPQGVLFSNGTFEDLFMGMIVVVIYVSITMRKLRLSIMHLLDVTALGALACSSVYSLFMAWEAHRYLVPLTLLLWLVIRDEPNGTGNNLRSVLLVYGSLLLLLSLFKPGGDVILLLTLEQWTGLGMSLAGEWVVYRQRSLAVRS